MIIHRIVRMAGIVMLALAGLVLITGCRTPNQGTNSGRVDPYRTTSAERHSGLPLPAAMMEFSDEVAQQLAQDLAQLPHVRNAPAGEQVIVLVGDIENKTGNVSSSEFELLRSRLRSQLLGSRHVTDRVRFVERRRRMSNIAERERVASDGFYADPADYDPRMTFALNGDFMRIHRGDTNQYYMEFMLVHFATNDIVFSKSYDLKQQR